MYKRGYTVGIRKMVIHINEKHRISLGKCLDMETSLFNNFWMRKHTLEKANISLSLVAERLLVSSGGFSTSVCHISTLQDNPFEGKQTIP
jgi:hypothetical protein